MMGSDGHDKAVEQARGTLDDVEMAIGDGIERPRLKRDGHGP
jgi:hypothetical protein